MYQFVAIRGIRGLCGTGALPISVCFSVPWFKPLVNVPKCHNSKDNLNQFNGLDCKRIMGWLKLQLKNWQPNIKAFNYTLRYI